MPVLFNFDDVDAIPVAHGVTRRELITPERVGNDCLALDRWDMDAGSRLAVEVEDTDLAWFQLLDGSAVLDGSEGKHRLDTSHVVFLPPGFSGDLSTGAGTAVLYGAVPDAKRFDSAFEASRPGFRCVNWRAEPMLDSEHDARKRIYLVTPTLFGTKAVKGEMIVYPPGTQASNHHHEGAEHFQYIISGRARHFSARSPTRFARATPCTTTSSNGTTSSTTATRTWSSSSTSSPPSAARCGSIRNWSAPGCPPARTSTAASLPGTSRPTAPRKPSIPRVCRSVR